MTLRARKVSVAFKKWAPELEPGPLDPDARSYSSSILAVMLTESTFELSHCHVFSLTTAEFCHYF